MESTSLWKVRGAILSTVFGTLFVFGLLGWGIDWLVGTRPKVFLVAILLSFPVSNVLAIRFARQAVKPPTS